MRIVFIGNVNFSHSILEKLLSMDVTIAGVCTKEYSSFNSDHCDLMPLCEQNNLAWKYVDDVNSKENIDWIESKSADVILCFGWSQLLSKKVLDITPLGVVGFHPTALPANRGHHPIIWALALGLNKTASTFFLMDSGADSGAIISQKEINIEITDDADSLYKKITNSALQQIEIFLPKLADNSIKYIEQDLTHSNLWRKRNVEDGLIDWRMSANSIHNLVRALTKPYVGAHFIFRGKEIKVWKVKVVNDVPENIEAGKVLKTTNGEVLVKCGELGICLLDTDLEFNPREGEYL